MAKYERVVAAQDQLNRVLGFFPRVDAKASVLLTIDLGMLALLAVNAPAFKDFGWGMGSLSIITLLLIGSSLFFLYRNGFPHLKGGNDSLIYFREIAKRTEAKYIEAFSNLNEDEYLKDVLSQVWRNSEILKIKFDHLRTAFIMLAVSIVPWLALLVIFALNSPKTQISVK